MRSTTAIIFFLLVSLLILVTACSQSETSQAVDQAAAPSPNPTQQIVKDEIVKPDITKVDSIFYEEIDRVVASVGKKDLRTLKLEQSEIEIRAWAGFGLTSTSGFILQRINNNWKAFHIYSDIDLQRSKDIVSIPLNEPSKSWNVAWESLKHENILVLPNAESINCSAGYTDGYSYVIEVKKGDTYHAYYYDNPDTEFENRCKEADNILNIAKIITDDYGADGFLKNFQ